jgi:hypothetical protein
MNLGDVFITEWDNSTVKVIGLDEFQVFYDAYTPHDNKWIFSENFNKTCYFYTAERIAFEQKSLFKGNEPLTDRELHYFQPELPFRLGRYSSISWDMDVEGSLNNTNEPVLKANKIFLRPFGKNGTFKKASLLTSVNSEGFYEEELILSAQQLQMDTGNAASNGIGIFRLGIEKGLPLYYIGSFIDNARIMEKYN